MEDDRDPGPMQNKEVRRFGKQYQGREKPDLVDQQLQLSEPEVRTDNLADTLNISCDPNSDDLPIALRKGKRSCAKYPIS
ncbi:hypothetical protein SESBI_26220 [Sesbania bispinosa]|nr:hypothetical protein SESBI_26220 [Sesbania bispinosa]